MVRMAIRVLAALTVLVVYLPFQASPGEGSMPQPFLMRIVDPAGNGIPHVRVTSDNGIVCHTRADGSIHWTERSLMSREVRFLIQAPDMRATVVRRVLPDGQVEITLPK
jgi:hypothetical protein